METFNRYKGNISLLSGSNPEESKPIPNQF